MSGGCGCRGRIERCRGTGLLLEERIVFTHLLAPVLLAGRNLLAAEDDPLEKEDMILSVEIGLGDCKNVIEEELAKVF